MNNTKPIYLFLKSHTEETALIDKFLAKNIDHINNKKYFIKKYMVNSENIINFRKNGIESIPYMIINTSIKVAGANNIIRKIAEVLSDNTRIVEIDTRDYMRETIEEEEEETDENDNVRNKLADFERRRSRLSEKRVVKPSRQNNSTYNNDDDFVNSSSKVNHVDENDEGDIILEEERLEFAKSAGIKPNNKDWKARMKNY